MGYLVLLVQSVPTTSVNSSISLRTTMFVSMLFHVLLLPRQERPSENPLRSSLITPLVLQRKRARKASKLNNVLRNQEEAAAYKKLVAQRQAEQRELRRSLISKRRSTRRSQKVADKKE